MLADPRRGVLVFRFGGNQHLAQPDLLGLFHLALVLVVELLHLLLGDVRSGADFLAHYLLRDDLVPHVLLEILKGNALRLGCLFQLFHRFQLHLLAHFVESLDQFGVGRDPKVLAFFEQQLLIDQVAQNVFSFGKDLVAMAGVLLLASSLSWSLLRRYRSG